MQEDTLPQYMLGAKTIFESQASDLNNFDAESTQKSQPYKVLETVHTLDYYTQRDQKMIKDVVSQSKTLNDLKVLNRVRLKSLNQVLANQKKDSPWVYPYDFQTYEDH